MSSEIIKTTYHSLSEEGYKSLESIQRLLSLVKIKDYDTIDSVFKYYFENENLADIREYSKFYNKRDLVKWIFNIVKLDKNKVESILDGNVKINSFLEYALAFYKNDKTYQDKILGIQTNDIVREISLLNYPNILNTDVLINDIPSKINTFDVIFFDFPLGIHNIIHANCCSRIKKLKIRGTKSEPLLLQYVMTSLNKNGRAVLIVPESLLYSDSLQPIQTRKYLLDNFNVKKIVELENMVSLLYFENNGKTTSIEFSKLYNMTEHHIMKLDVSNVDVNNSLYYKHYSDLNKPTNNTIEYKEASELVTFNHAVGTTVTTLVLDKYYKSPDSIRIESNPMYNVYNEDSIYITDKDTSNFNINYMQYVLQCDYSKFTKGKMHQFDIDKIKKHMIPVLSKMVQQSISNYMKLSNNIINNNNNYIKNYNEMKQSLLDTIPRNNMVEISSICNILSTPLPNSVPKKLIGIIRNGLTAGTVNLVKENTVLSNNSHYLELNSKVSIEYVYHIMKHNESKLIELANLTPQPNLNKSNLLAFKIADLDTTNQQQLSLYCEDFDANIEKYKIINENIMNKNIIDIVLKLNHI
jgi:hypothetical protein